MSTRANLKIAVASTLLLAMTPALADETQSLEELRNTVVNLLETLVQKGVMTREQAQEMVAKAQGEAASGAQRRAETDAAEVGAVRVTHVPEIVKKQIGEQVRTELKDEVTKDVIAQAKADQWGVPGALPDWIGRIRWSGDVRFRAQSDMFASDNIPFAYFDFLTINSRGGTIRAQDEAFLNTTEDRFRERVRLRLALDAAIAKSFTAGVRLASGNASDPVSTNQTAGQSGGRYQIAIDQAYLRFDAPGRSSLPWLSIAAGRLPNPFYSTDLVWDPDLTFEGIVGTWRLGLGDTAHTYVTAGAFPLQELELSTQDKWLYGGQLGLDASLGRGLRLKVAGSYYYYDNITGRLNPFEDDVYDFTAPEWMQKGNTLFNIRNSADPTAELWALAAEYRLANATVGLEMPIGRHRLSFTGDYVRNLGYDEDAVLAQPSVLTTDGRKRVEGYQAELGFGTASSGIFGDWRAYVAYRYLERDAVLDAFTDSDFHGGGTDAKGYSVRAEWWFRDRAWLTLRYLSASEIDGPPLGLDILMLDINGQF